MDFCSKLTLSIKNVPIEQMDTKLCINKTKTTVYACSHARFENTARSAIWYFLCAINSGNFFGDLIIFINSRKMFGLKK